MKQQKKKDIFQTLDAYESEIENLLPDQQSPPTQGDKISFSHLQKAAALTLDQLKKEQEKQRKKRNINLRLSEDTILGLQSLALHEGLPYQTYIASILHKHVHTQLLSG